MAPPFLQSLSDMESHFIAQAGLELPLAHMIFLLGLPE
jgi:hypothetical protein